MKQNCRPIISRSSPARTTRGGINFVLPLPAPIAFPSTIAVRRQPTTIRCPAHQVFFSVTRMPSHNLRLLPPASIAADSLCNLCSLHSLSYPSNDTKEDTTSSCPAHKEKAKRKANHNDCMEVHSTTLSMRQHIASFAHLLTKRYSAQETP